VGKAAARDVAVVGAYFRARDAYRRAQRAQPQRCEAVISKFERGSGTTMTSAAAFEMYDMAGNVGGRTPLADMLASLDGATAAQ
jgi:hypothetical protein